MKQEFTTFTRNEDHLLIKELHLEIITTLFGNIRNQYTIWNEAMLFIIICSVHAEECHPSMKTTQVKKQRCILLVQKLSL